MSPGGGSAADPYSVASNGVNQDSNSNVSQFTIYLERIIEWIEKLDESTPLFFKSLFKSFDSLFCVDESGICTKSASHMKALCDDLDHSMGNFSTHFN
jgi:hypothetical protein